MEVDRERERDKMCFVCEKWGYMANNYWQRKRRERRVVETPQKLAKDNRRQ